MFSVVCIVTDIATLPVQVLTSFLHEWSGRKNLC